MPDNIIPVKIILLEGGKVPQKAHEGDTCYDVYAREDCVAYAGAITPIPLGFRVECPKGWALQIRSRSGLSGKNIFIANSPATIDNEYRGEVLALIYNTKPYNHHLVINAGDRIGQMCIEKQYDIKFVEVEMFDNEKTSRGEGGFGSTGIYS